MTISFDVNENLKLDSLYFKDTSLYDTGEIIVGYNLSYVEYFSGVSYTYEITEYDDLVSILSGGWFSIESFVTTEGSYNEYITDNAYSMTMEVIYEVDSIEDSEDLTEIALFYQDILNKYSTSHLRYEWNERLQGDSNKSLKMAEELTWIKGLEEASYNTDDYATFLTILNTLSRYFILEYNYS